MTRRTVWEEGHEPGGRVVALAAALIAVAVVIDLSLGQGLGLLLDLVFVGVCVLAALMVRPRDFFAVGVLPPLLLFGLFVALAVVRRDAIARPDDDAVQAVVSGLSHHALALGGGYALCLAVLGIRDRFTRGVARPGALTRWRLRISPGLQRPPSAPPERPGTSRRPWSAPRESRPPR